MSAPIEMDTKGDVIFAASAMMAFLVLIGRGIETLAELIESHKDLKSRAPIPTRGDSANLDITVAPSWPAIGCSPSNANQREPHQL